MTQPRNYPASHYRRCACRDCVIETIEGICQRCRASGCSAQGDKGCLAPDAYTLSARKHQ